MPRRNFSVPTLPQPYGIPSENMCRPFIIRANSAPACMASRLRGEIFDCSHQICHAIYDALGTLGTKGTRNFTYAGCFLSTLLGLVLKGMAVGTLPFLGAAVGVIGACALLGAALQYRRLRQLSPGLHTRYGYTLERTHRQLMGSRLGPDVRLRTEIAAALKLLRVQPLHLLLEFLRGTLLCPAVDAFEYCRTRLSSRRRRR